MQSSGVTKFKDRPALQDESNLYISRPYNRAGGQVEMSMEATVLDLAQNAYINMVLVAHDRPRIRYQ